jgi:hypothetical protein
MRDPGRPDEEDEEDRALAALAEELAAARPVGEGAVGLALQLFDSWQLPLPPLPSDLASSLRVLGPSLLGTRQGTPSPYGIDWFLDDLAAGPPDYLLLGHAGHGVNSWAMHYYLVSRTLALFLQLPWGGAYTDAEPATAAVATAFAGAERLILHPGRLGRLAPGQRLVVIDSAFAEPRWGVLSQGEATSALERSGSPLHAALAWAESAAGSLNEREGPRPLPPQPIWG